MTHATVTLNGVPLMMDASGALWWPERRLLAVADLHLEKGSAYAERSTFLPPYDTRATIDALERLVRRWRPHTVLALGDSFHDGR
ncbi:MAG: phosphoesterase, partial [Alphaproteobacteria bacterium]